MAEQKSGVPTPKTDSNRKEIVRYVVSTKMAKTVVVEVDMQRAHPKYRRVISRSKKFYAHDEENTARAGDVVRIVETRPLSKLKRWRLAEVIQRAAIVPGAEKIEQAS
ncbi:MAG: 30S ribosomal protein S17 [Acidobacteria bacterium]|nr:30S ribosomal protein S17 [Acidobacteriota bacterium]